MILKLLFESSNIFEESIEQQVISLAKKELEIGISNTLLTILILCSIYAPFQGISNKLLEADILQIFDQDISKLKEILSTLKNNSKKLNINVFLEENLFLLGVKSLVGMLDFSISEQKEVIYLKNNFDILKKDISKFKIFTYKLEKVGFNVNNFNFIDTSLFSFLELDSLESRTISSSFQLFDFFQKNPNYVTTLNKKISRMVLLNKFITEINLNIENNNEFFSLDVVEKMLALVDTNEISNFTMDLLSVFNQIIENVINFLKTNEKLLVSSKKTSVNIEEIETKEYLTRLIINTLEVLKVQNEKHENLNSKVYFKESLSFEELRSLLLTIEKELQGFIISLDKLIEELKSEMLYKTSKNIQSKNIYTAPNLVRSNITNKPVNVDPLVLFQESINSKDDKEAKKNEKLDLEEQLDLRKTNMKNGLNISDFLKELNIKKIDF